MTDKLLDCSTDKLLDSLPPINSSSWIGMCRAQLGDVPVHGLHRSAVAGLGDLGIAL
ncbi:MAG: hypothetical protein ABWX96_19115 [Propionibacteriaceae bacterium]